MNSTTRGQTKEGKTTRRVKRAQAPVRRAALVSARRRDCARQRQNRFSILCDSLKYTTCLDVHYKACLKHFDSLMDQNQRNERDGDLLFVCLPLSLMRKLTVICCTRSQPWGYGQHPRGSRMQQRTHENITGPLISTHFPSPNKYSVLKKKKKTSKCCKHYNSTTKGPARWTTSPEQIDRQ